MAQTIIVTIDTSCLFGVQLHTEQTPKYSILKKGKEQMYEKMEM